MSDRVHAAAVGVKAAPAQSQLDRAATDPGGEQLRVRDHPLLASGELGDHRIAGCYENTVTVMVFS
jgi:hypothetical protein